MDRLGWDRESSRCGSKWTIKDNVKNWTWAENTACYCAKTINISRSSKQGRYHCIAMQGSWPPLSEMKTHGRWTASKTIWPEILAVLRMQAQGQWLGCWWYDGMVQQHQQQEKEEAAFARCRLAPSRRLCTLCIPHPFLYTLQVYNRHQQTKTDKKRKQQEHIQICTCAMCITHPSHSIVQ